ncbi:uncharacterized protein G2W53_011867 [Senna tora]|uniref:Uncharacterized protein n=1 Tax=Senna tora TaxID=362788 RepID=A0A834WSG4_9FABA|nr:uncharacterized protein G2W53_011867 [Senna tora]
MATMLAKSFGGERCLTLDRWGGDDQPWMLGMSKGTSLLSARGGERLQRHEMSEGVSLHFAWLSSPAYASP